VSSLQSNKFAGTDPTGAAAVSEPPHDQEKSSKAAMNARTKSPEGTNSLTKLKSRSDLRKPAGGASADACEASLDSPRPGVQRKPSNFLGVFSKRRRSKSAEREKGVLGKEGARIVLSEG